MLYVCWRSRRGSEKRCPSLAAVLPSPQREDSAIALTTEFKETINSLVTRAGHVAQAPADVNLVDLQLPKEKLQEIDTQLLQLKAVAQNEFLKSLRPAVSWAIKRRIEAYNKDPLYVLKIANREYFRLVVLVFVQLSGSRYSAIGMLPRYSFAMRTTTLPLA